MSCFGKFKESDRICQLCLMTNIKCSYECRNITKDKHDKAEELQRIKRSCPYRTQCYDEYEPFDGCSKNGNGRGRFADDCIVTMECGNR
jgi:hypothetical protein